MFRLAAHQNPDPSAPAPSVVARAGDDAGIDAVSNQLSRDAFIHAANELGAVGRCVAMLTLDVERFTDLNEHFGLACGDFLLFGQISQGAQSVAALYLPL